MIQIAVVLIGAVVTVDAALVALADVRYERARLDRRMRRR